MKYGAHIFLWTECWDESHLWLFSHAKQLGLDVLEIAIGDDVSFNSLSVRKAAGDQGMELVISPGGIWPMEADLSLPGTGESGFAMDWHKRWIDKGANAGATAYTGALYGHPGRVLRTSPSVDEFRRVCENLYCLAEYADSSGIQIVLEPMSHFRTHFLNTPQQAVRLLDSAGHPNLKVLFDTYHAVTEIRDYYNGIKTIKGNLWGLHACENDRGCPGSGILPWKSIFQGLKEINFDGYLILEAYNSSLRCGEFAYSRGMFHHVCDEGDGFVKQGLAFLKTF